VKALSRYTWAADKSWGSDWSSDDPVRDPWMAPVLGDPALKSGSVSAALLPFGRLVISADGNDHDKDDIGATPMSLAMLAHAGRQADLKLYVYHDHVWSDKNLAQKQAMTDSVLGGRDHFDFTTTNFISARDNQSGAINHIVSQINASSATDPLTIIMAGPAHVVARAVKLSDPTKREFVTVISHSGWNDTHPTEHGSPHTWASMRNTGVTLDHIDNQNPLLSTSPSPWDWLKNNADPDLQWVYSRNQFSTKYDVSDSGMLYYVLTGDEHGTPQKFQDFFATPPAANAGFDFADIESMLAQAAMDEPAELPLSNMTDAQHLCCEHDDHHFGI
jgi:hypothetical protein